MRVIFLGTPDFAVPVLQKILGSAHEVVAVVTQPDKASGRKKKLQAPPVKVCAEDAGLKVLQYDKISKEGVAELTALNADIMVTAAYGQILSDEILGLCKHGVINAHGSILPKYRGASPVQCALLAGEEVVGVTVMQTAKAVDSGDIILTKSIQLDGTENIAECMAKLAVVGGEGIVEALDSIEAGTAIFTEQNHNEATFCSKFSKEDGQLDFTKTSKELVNFVRGMNPWPSAFCGTPNGKIKVLRAVQIEYSGKEECGTVVLSDKKTVAIKTADSALSILELQGEGAKAMDIASYLRGKTIEKGTMWE
ncbi:MAG: methionyl-tRNA formyltransferase [Bacillota bacterium]